MLGMIARRLLSLIPVLLVVSFVVFMLVELVPGDAATTVAGGVNATPEKIAEVREELGLDQPVLERYVDWLGRRGAARLRPFVPQLGRTAHGRGGDQGTAPGVARARAGRPLRGHRHRHPARHPRRHAPGRRGRPVERDRHQRRSRHPQLRARVPPHPGVRVDPRLVPRARLHEVLGEPAPSGSRRSRCRRSRSV